MQQNAAGTRLRQGSMNGISSYIIKKLDETVLLILDTIHFEADKREFTDAFWDLCFQQTLAILVSDLSLHEKDIIFMRIAALKSIPHINEFLYETFGNEAYTHALYQGMNNVFEDFLKEANPMVATRTGRKKIQEQAASFTFLLRG